METDDGASAEVKNGLSVIGVTYTSDIVNHNGACFPRTDPIRVSPSAEDLDLNGNLADAYRNRLADIIAEKVVLGLECFQQNAYGGRSRALSSRGKGFRRVEYSRSASQMSRVLWGQQLDHRGDFKQKGANLDSPPPEPELVTPWDDQTLIVSLSNERLVAYWVSRAYPMMQVVKNFPDDLKNKVLLAITKTLKEAREEPLDRKLQVRVAVMYAVLFTPMNQSADGSQLSARQSVLKAASIIIAGDWNAFVCGWYRPRPKAREVDLTSQKEMDKFEELAQRRCLEFLKEGKSGDAYKALMRDPPATKITEKGFRESVLPRFPGIFINNNALESDQLPEHLLPELVNLTQELRSNHPHRPDSFVQIDVEDMKQQIKKAPNKVSPGWDQHCAEQFKWLLRASSSQNVSSNQQEYMKEECWFLERLLNGQLDGDVAQLFASARAVLIPKRGGPEAGWRVISASLCRVKLALRLQISSLLNLVKETSGPAQKAFDDDGTSKIIHATQARMMERPSDDLVLSDIKDAFPFSARFPALLQTQAVNLPIHPYLVQALSHEFPSLSAFALNSGFKCVVKQFEGTQAGSVVGPYIFSVSAAPYFKDGIRILQSYDPDAYGAYYHDDGTFHASTEACVEMIKYMQTHESDKRLYMSMNKFEVLVGLKDSREEALRVAEMYVRLGFQAANVKLHPKNAEMDAEAIMFAKLKYGARVLGCPVGSEEYKKGFYEDALAKLSSELDRLDRLQNNQAKLMLLRSVVSAKFTHFVRAEPMVVGSAMDWFATEHDKLIRKFFARSILGVDENALSSLAWLQAKTDAGPALRFLRDVAHSAYLASFSAAAQVIQTDGRCPELVEQMLATNTRQNELELQGCRPAARAIQEVLCAYQQQMSRDRQGGISSTLELVMPLKHGEQIQEQGHAQQGKEIRVRARQWLLYRQVKESFYDNLKSQAKRQEDLARIWTSHDQAAGSLYMREAYMNSDPNSVFNMESSAFRVACLRTLGVPFGNGKVKYASHPAVRMENGPLWGNQPLVCSCKSEWDCNGQHVFECAKEGRMSYLHNSIRDDMVRVCQMVRIPVSKEVKSGSEFEHSHGRDRELKDADVAINMRLPGIVPPNFTGNFDKIAIDVKTMAYSSEGGIDEAYDRKYTQANKQRIVERNAVNGYVFLPAVYGDMGGVHPVSFQIMEAISIAASENPGRWYGKQKQLLKYMRVRLSVIIAMASAANIMESVSTLREQGRGKRQVGPDDSQLNVFKWVSYGSVN